MPRQHNAKSKQGHKYGTYAWYQDEHMEIPVDVYVHQAPQKKSVTAYQTYRDEEGILHHTVDAEGNRVKSKTIKKHTYAQLGCPPSQEVARQWYDFQKGNYTPYGISKMSHKARVAYAGAHDELGIDLDAYAAKMAKNRQIGAKKAAKTKKANKKAAVKTAKKTSQKAVGVTAPVLVETNGSRPMHKGTLYDASEPLPTVLRSAEMREFAPRAALPGSSSRSPRRPHRSIEEIKATLRDAHAKHRVIRR